MILGSIILSFSKAAEAAAGVGDEPASHPLQRAHDARRLPEIGDEPASIPEGHKDVLRHVASVTGGAGAWIGRFPVAHALGLHAVSVKASAAVTACMVGGGVAGIAAPIVVYVVCVGAYECWQLKADELTADQRAALADQEIPECEQDSGGRALPLTASKGKGKGKGRTAKPRIQPAWKP